MAGEITLITGPIKSGKTIELVRQLKVFEHRSKSCVIIKHVDDTNTHLESLKEGLDLTSEIVELSSLDELSEEDYRNIVCSTDAIFIDNGEAFSSLANFCDTMAYQHKQVFVTGLQCTSEREIPKMIAELFPLCENIITLKSICMHCSNKASFFVIYKRGSFLKRTLCRNCYPRQ